jgi:hypothetical protein
MNKRASAFIVFLAIITIVPPALAARPISEDSQRNNINTQPSNTVPIFWQAPYNERGATVIPGSLEASFGRFEFRWVIDAEQKVKLINLEPAGSAEVPMREKKILFLLANDGTTRMFQEWFPLTGGQEPYAIRSIAVVSTKDLFSPVSDKVPPIAPPPAEVKPINWENPYQRNNAQYIQASLHLSFGAFNIYWRSKPGQVPELITLEAPGAGELPPVEQRLSPWFDEAAGITYICQERFPMLHQGFVPYLQCLAKVKTDELLAGLKRLPQVQQ